MPKLSSLKQSYKDWNEPTKAEKDAYYPSLYLEGKSLDAMDVGNIRAGTELTMVATVRVSSSSDSATGARSMSFEILEAAMSPKGDEKDSASILFPNG
ncbi:hypothetical protein [Rhizobium lentis]|uniref:hypothetical protein n=1 Tax=Rhizobium lentis TaxID=1138194 RepID=UPI001C829550|nr:hypothetical protein [Rhizobium lentis]MBX5020421.1 hypothetical protein [Rhizobium lentis]